MRKATLLFLVDEPSRKILLAMKKRGFGAGKFNGIGGKVEKRENIVAAAARETKEEIGVTVIRGELKRRGLLRFSFEEKPEWDMECHVFRARVWRGEPAESEEMAPQWFDFDAIPYERMWVDDRHWLPRFLANEAVKAEFLFSSDGSKILRGSVNGERIWT